jgi:hypothetical protein
VTPVGVEGRIGLRGAGAAVGPDVGIVGKGPVDVTDCAETDPGPTAATTEVLDHKLGEVAVIIASIAATKMNEGFRVKRFDPSPQTCVG